jgi:hypothetical protein
MATQGTQKTKPDRKFRKDAKQKAFRVARGRSQCVQKYSVREIRRVPAFF